MLVIMIWWVFMCFVIVVVIIFIGLVFVISMFLFIKLKFSVVWIVLLNGLKIDVRLLLILFGILNVLNVGIIKYLVKVFGWFMFMFLVLWYKCMWFVW